MGADGIHHKVEQQLKRAGIPVLSRTEALQAPGKPYLYVNLNAMDNSGEGYAFSISIELKQEVTLAAQRQPVIAVTWKNHQLVTTSEQAAQPIFQVLNGQIHNFILDYMQANRASFEPVPDKRPAKWT